MFKERYDYIGVVRNGTLDQIYEFSGRGGLRCFLCACKIWNSWDRFFHLPFSKSVSLRSTSLLFDHLTMARKFNTANIHKHFLGYDSQPFQFTSSQPIFLEFQHNFTISVSRDLLLRQRVYRTQRRNVSMVVGGTTALSKTRENSSEMNI
jgi:hypothetical protein